MGERAKSLSGTRVIAAKSRCRGPSRTEGWVWKRGQGAHGQIVVDVQRNTVVLPIYGYAVPYHISTIKNVTKTEEAEHIVLRINFQSPGQIAGKKEDMVGLPMPVLRLG